MLLKPGDYVTVAFAPGDDCLITGKVESCNQDGSNMHLLVETGATCFEYLIPYPLYLSKTVPYDRETNRKPSRA